MRYVCPAAVTAVLLSTLSPLGVFGQGAQGLSITNYQFVSEQRWSQTQSYVTYRADLVNAGPARAAVTASVTSLVPEVQVVQGQSNLHFSPVPAYGQVSSSNTFTLFIDRSVPFTWDNLQWNFLAPVANAGLGQTAKVGSTVNLDGSGSTNPSGYGSLAYSWAFTSRPVGTGAVLFNSDTAKPYFVVDVAGTYVLTLTVNNGSGTDSATVTISTTNSAPVANAGPNQTVAVGALVTLNGSGSSDADGDPLTYTWTIISRPGNSTAALTGSNTVSPVFVADKAGTYIVQLVVNDGKVNSTPSTVIVTTQNTPPVANAGSNQIIAVGSLVQLNGSASTDVDGDPLTYRWSLLSIPSGSTAKLSNATAVNPTFTADLPGSYVAQLIVNDGFSDSAPSTVTITTNPMLAPTANAGQNQTVAHRATVQLSGSGTDPQHLPLTYLWALTTKPAGSNAVLSSTTTANPTIVADYPGTYVAQLTVNNGYLSSLPSTVTITTTNTPPVANAGVNQNVAVGALVTLDGSGSSDADNDPLTYSWSIMSIPTGSLAKLSSTSAMKPTFMADMAGTYVIQLIVNDSFANSAPSTVTVVAGINTITLTPNPLNVAPGKPGTLTVTLGTAAGSTGQLVSLAVSDPSVATIQPTLMIPAGATGANVTVTGGSGTGTGTIIATAAGFSPGTTIVNLAVPSIALSLDTGTVGITHTINGTVTLNAPAPPGGVSVALSASPDGIVTLQPSSVPIAPGATSGTFTVTGQQSGSAAIQGTAAGYTSGSTNVTVGMLGAIILPTNVTVGPGQSVPFPVKLATGAPVGGVTITLNSSDTSTLTISPSSITIPDMSTQPGVQPQVIGIKVGTANIVASAQGFFGDIQPVQVAANLSFSPQLLTMGINSTQNLTLTLSGPAPAGGLTIFISSSNQSVATVPSSVMMAPNATSVVVPVTATGLGQAVIHASALPAFPDTTANVSVVNFGPIGVPQSTSVALGQVAPFPISLPLPAPAGGATITLNSSDNSKVTVSPSTVSIAVGQTAPATQPQVTGVSVGNATVTASGSGYSSGSGPVQVTASMSFSPQNLTITGAATQNLTLTLSSAAPAAGLTVNVSSSNPAVATVPATVTFAANSTTVSVPVTGVTAGSTVIHASATNIPDTTANVTVQSTGTVTLPASVSVALTQSTALMVSLTSPAPAGGVTVTLSSSDTSKVTVSPATVKVAAGETTPATQPQVTGVNLGTVTVSASAPGFTSANSSVLVTATVAFSPQNVTINGLGAQNVMLTLSAPAPTSVGVSLSSGNTGIATVPASVTFPPNTTSVNVPITAVATGSTIIHASALPNIADTTANVTVQPGSGVINLPANLAVGLGQSATLTVSLSVAAPSGGVTVSLSSGDTSKVTLSAPSVLIPEGATVPAIQPKVTGVNFGSVSVTATATGYSTGTSLVQVTGSISFAQQNLTLGVNATQNLTLNLSGPAPAGGLTINTSSSNPGVATVPSTVNFAANTTSVSVPVTGVAAGSAIIHAAAPPILADTTANVTVQAGIVLPANMTIEPGQSVAYPVTLSAPAPSGGVYIALGSSDTSKATLSMSSVFIVEGQTAPSGTPRINGVNYGTATITASANGYSTASQQVTVGATLTLTPASMTMVGSGTENMGLSLSSFAPAGGLTVNLSSSNPSAVTVPASVTIAANANTAAIPVTSVGTGSATITASTGIPTVPNTTATVNVLAPGAINLPANLAVGLGQSVAFAISLGTPAPTGGVTVTLTSGDTSKVGISPTSVFIAQGSTTPTTQPQVSGGNLGAVSISASAQGYTQASTTVTVNATVSFSPQTLTIIGTATQSLMLTLSAAAPASGVTIHLSSSNTNVATVPAVLTFYPDGSSFSSLVVPVTGVAPGNVQIHANATPFIPDVTADVTVVSPGTILLPSGVSLSPWQTSAFPVTLGTPAPAGGVTVALASSDITKVTISPASVTVGAGQTTPSVQPQVTAVNYGTVNISASASGYTAASAPVQVGATMTLSPQNLPIVGNNTANLLLTLSAPAPASGLTINLSSGNPLVAGVPGSVLIGSNGTTVSVPVTGVSVGSAIITASAAAPNIPNATATVTVGAASGIILPSSVAVGLGKTTAVTVALPSPAPAGGVSVSLASGDISKVTISPATVTVDEGQTVPAIQPQVTGVNIGMANISASASGYASANASVQVTATVGFSPTGVSIIAGTVGHLTLTLSGAAPASGISVDLSSESTSVATVPPSALFTPGSTSVDVPITGIAPGNAVIHASALPYIADTTANVTVQTPGAIVLPTNASVGLGQSVDFPVSLPYPAPSNGVTIALSSADPSKVSISPADVFIAAGQTAPAAPPRVTGVDLATTNINASAPGYTSATVGVQVTATLTFSPQNVTIVGLVTENLTLTLSAPAPAAGLTVILSSTNQAVATVPTTVLIAANTKSVSVPVTAVAFGTTVIHAGALPNVPDVTAEVTVASPGTINLPTNVTVGPNQSATFAVKLGTPAPMGGVTVTLSSSDSSKLTISPASVTIASGQTTPPTQPQVTGVNFGSANVNAKATGYSDASAPVQVTAALNFPTQNATISGLVSQSVVLNLSAPAPSGGVTINLTSSDTSIAKVPDTVVFPSNATTVNVPVTAVAIGGPVLIHASSLPYLADVSMSITVQSAGLIGLPDNPAVAMGQSAGFAVTLPVAAPAGGVTVTLSSADTSTVTISAASVTIDAGQTTPSTQPQIHGVNAGSAKINASAPGYTDASASVKVTATVSFAPNTLTITGLTTQNLTLNASAASPNGLSVNLTSDNPAVVTVPATIAFPANSTTVSVPVTGVAIGGPVTIHAGVPPYIPDATASITVQSAGAIGVPANTSVGLGQSTALAVTLPAAAPPGGVTVTLASGDTNKVTVSPATINIDAGQTTPATQPQVTGVSFGTVNVAVSAPGYTSASAPVQVTGTITFADKTLTISGLTTQNLKLNLSGPAPSGGLTINTSSSDTSIATVPQTVTFAAGTTSVNVPVTGVAIGGPVTIHASATPALADTTASVTVQSAGPIALAPASVGLGQSAALSLTLPAAAPAGGVTVTLTSGDTSRVTVTSSVTIPAGQTSPSSPPQVSGVNLGTANITASAPGYTSNIALVTVTASVSFTQNPVTITGLTTANILLALSATAPSTGLTVNLASSDPTVATVPSSATFAAGATAVSILVTAIGAGSTTIHASASPYIADATTTVNVIVSSAGTISLGSTWIGKDLQTSVVLSLSTAAPIGGLPITLTSSDAGRVVIGSSPPILVGLQSVSFTMPEGSQAATIVLQGLADNGSATVTATAAGWTPGTATVNLSPSGFVIAGPNGIGALSIATNVGISTPLTVYSARLDSAHNYVEMQQLRGGATKDPNTGAPVGGLFVTVPLTSVPTTVGTIAPASLNFTGGDTPVSGLNATFTARGVGNATVTVGTPNGFSTPLNVNSIIANVGPSGLVPPSITVGNNLEMDAAVTLNGAPSSDVYMTVSSNDPSKALLANRADGTDGKGTYLGGSASISVRVKAGFTYSEPFYVYGLGSSGSVTYTVSLSGFGTATGTITLAPSGVTIAVPGGAIVTTPGAAPTTVNLTTGILDGAGNFLTAQAVSGQGAISVHVTSGDSTVGTITQSPVSIGVAMAAATTQFQPAGVGSTRVSVDVPPGFSPPSAQYASVPVTVSTAGIGIADGISIGNKLAFAGYLTLGQAPPPGGVTVTLTSNNPSQLHLAASPTDTGSPSIQITITPPATGAAYYLYGLANSGTVGYSVSAPGYVGRTASAVTLTPSGFVLGGSGGMVGGLLFAGVNADTTFYVMAAQVDADGNYIQTQPLAGGQSVDVPLGNTNPAAGTVPSDVMFSGGADTVTAQFHGVTSGGNTTITAGTPSGFSPAGTSASIPVWVF